MHDPDPIDPEAHWGEQVADLQRAARAAAFLRRVILLLVVLLGVALICVWREGA